MTVKLTLVFLVGDLWKSILHLYTPLSSVLQKRKWTGESLKYSWNTLEVNGWARGSATMAFVMQSGHAFCMCFSIFLCYFVFRAAWCIRVLFSHFSIRPACFFSILFGNSVWIFKSLYIFLYKYKLNQFFKTN